MYKKGIENSDKELYNIILKEKKRQKNNLNLIASENIMLKNVKEIYKYSFLNNKYSEGYENKRYYGGTKYIEKIEELAIKRTLKAFNLNENNWGVNVQCFSGSIANFAIYNAICENNDTILGMSLSSGGHLSHGYKVNNKCISATSKYFNSISYGTNEYGFIDYEDLENKAFKYKPKIIIAGASAYSQLIDYKKIKQICKKNNALLLADISHIAGLVISNLIPSPFLYADIVMTTTHKILRGPKGSIIIFKNNLKEKINYSIFPSLQGGPSNLTIACIASLMKYVTCKKYKKYQIQVLINSQILCEELIKKNYNIVTNSTKNHMFLIDLKNKNISGEETQFILEKCKIICNKNYIYNDVMPCKPSAIRIGLPFITSQNFKEIHMIKIAKYIDIGIKITQEYKNNNFILTDNIKKQINFLKNKIKKFIFLKQFF